jgi:hypothetical protein
VAPVVIPVALRPAWDALQRCPTAGPATGAWLQAGQPRVAVGELPARVYGSYRPRGNQVTIARAVMRDRPEAIAVVLAHELRHVYQQAVGSPTDCVERELDAFSQQAPVWDELTQGGLSDPRTDLERQLNAVLGEYRIYGPRGILARILADRAYQEQCGF